jgi:uncharacterized protein (DUF952 family)
MIYRIAEAADWTQARKVGYFESPDLALEGFIHFSERAQVQRTADRYYPNRSGLILIQIDESLIPGDKVRRENTTGGAELFPHVYCPIPLKAVIATALLERETDGLIRWPTGW